MAAFALNCRPVEARAAVSLSITLNHVGIIYLASKSEINISSRLAGGINICQQMKHPIYIWPIIARGASC